MFFSRQFGSHFISFRTLFLIFARVSFLILISSRVEKKFQPCLKLTSMLGRNFIPG